MDLPLAANDPPGKWTVTARELLSGKSATGTLDVTVPKWPEESLPTPTVEWGRAQRATAALAKAKKVAIVSKTIVPPPAKGSAAPADAKPAEPLAAAADALADLLKSRGKQVVRLSSAEYLADLDTLLWKGFPEHHGEKGDVGKIQPRQPKYDLVLVLETSQHQADVVKADLLPIVLTATDPGPGRGLVQYAAMPVYNDEDALCIAGGDTEGLMAAIKSLAAAPAAPAAAAAVPESPGTALPGGSRRSHTRPAAGGPPERRGTPPPGLAQFIGTGVCELAVSPDARRIAVGLKGWGDNLIVLDEAGNILAKDLCGKFFLLDFVSRRRLHRPEPRE